jgi:competence protein ComEA
VSPRLWPAVIVALVLGLMGPAQAAPTSASTADGGDAEAAPVVDLNRAGVDELCTLPGIGRKKAEAIIALRERRPFTRVTQLLQIKGIGHKTLLKLKPRVTVTPPSPPTSPTTTPATASDPAAPEPAAPRVMAARR